MVYIPIAKNILLTGGIGDVLAIESFFSSEQRRALEGVFYATRAHKVIRQIFQALPNFPNLKRHTILWEDYSKVFAFQSKNEMVEHINIHNGSTEDDWKLRVARYQRWGRILEDVTDYSIAMIFSQCNEHQRPYTGSSVLNHQIADISRFCLPGNSEFPQRPENQHRLSHLLSLGELPAPLKFHIICPYTINDRRNSNRDFNQQDWEFLLNYLTKIKSFGVVLNLGADTIPQHPLIIDLSNQTTFCESVEILKQAKGYIGIDSCLSVLAAKMFLYPNLMVKSHNDHCYMWASVYFAPQVMSQPFLLRHFYGA